MKKNLIFSSATVTMLLLGTGCGGGSSSTATSNDLENVEKKIGYYLDSAVSGVDYSCAGVADGKTGLDGSFSYKDGVCTFSVGGIVLRRVDTSTIKGNIVFEDNLVTARFLQTLDSDGNSKNGIQIDVKVSDFISSGDINLNGTVPTTDEEITALVTQLQEKVDTYNGVIVTEEEVKSHLNETSSLIESIDGNITVSSDMLNDGSSSSEGNASMTTTPTTSGGSSSVTEEGSSSSDEGTVKIPLTSPEELTNSGLDGMITTPVTSGSNEGESSTSEMITSPMSG